jgi:lysophospholipase L1-like esterase
MRYVALGDSYTIGTAVREVERWPDQLVARVPGLQLVANLAVNGSTARDVLEVQVPALDALRPSLLTILVGVNDVIQGVTEADYRDDVRRIVDDLVARVGAARVIGLTTPDYTVTPAGRDYGDPAERSAAIRRFNDAFMEVLGDREVEVVDVYGLSLAAASDPSLVAADGLHPSARQYASWVDRIAELASRILAESSPG